MHEINGVGPFESGPFQNALHIGLQGGLAAPTQGISACLSAVQGGTALLSSGAVLMGLSWGLGALMLASAVPQATVHLRAIARRFTLTREAAAQNRMSAYLALLLSEPRMAREIRLLGIAGYLRKAFVGVLGSLHERERAHDRRELGPGLMAGALRIVAGAGALAWVIASAMRGETSVGEVTLCGSAVLAFQAGVASVIVSVVTLRESLMFFRAYDSLLAVKEPLRRAPRSCEVPRLEKGIELRNVWFRYSDGHPWVLSGCDLLIPAGRCMGLVGANGAGKSTLVWLLGRLYDPCEGEILWDGIDLRSFEPAELRQRMSVLVQDSSRFELTVRENVAFGQIGALDDIDRLRSALTDAGIGGLVERLPHGLDTRLSRSMAGDQIGVDLSGGEWQRIAVARSLIRPAEFQIVDEPTNGLDVEGEERCCLARISPTGFSR